MDKYKQLPETLAYIERVKAATTRDQTNEILEEVSNKVSELHPSTISHISLAIAQREEELGLPCNNQSGFKQLSEYAVEIWAADDRAGVMRVMGKGFADPKLDPMCLSVLTNEMQDKIATEGW